MKKSLRTALAFAAAALLATAASAQLPKPDTKTYGTVGSTAPVTQTTTVPVWTSPSGTYSAGGFATTTVQGGSTTNGSGGVIPDTRRGASSTSGVGVGITISK